MMEESTMSAVELIEYIKKHEASYAEPVRLAPAERALICAALAAWAESEHA